MKALAKEKPEVGLWQVDRPVPEIGPEDVLIKVKKTGICGASLLMRPTVKLNIMPKMTKGLASRSMIMNTWLSVSVSVISIFWPLTRVPIGMAL